MGKEVQPHQGLPPVESRTAEVSKRQFINSRSGGLFAEERNPRPETLIISRRRPSIHPKKSRRRFFQKMRTSLQANESV